MRKRPFVLIVLSTWLGWIVPSVAVLGHAHAQAAHGSGEYARLTAEAVREYNAGDFAEARALFERAHALRPNARTLRGLGVCSFELRHYAQAVEELRAALGDTRNPLGATQRAEAEDIVTRAQRFIATVRIEVEPESATLLLDGEPVEGRELTLDLGDYVLTARATGYREQAVKLRFEGGQTRDVRVQLVPLDLNVDSATQPERGATAATTAATAATDQGAQGSQSIFGRWWFWTTVGVVLAAGVTTALVLTHDPGHKPLEPGNVGGTILALKSAPAP